MTVKTLSEYPHEIFPIPKYKITYQPYRSPLKRIFSPKDLKLFLSLYQQTQLHPKSAVKEIEQLYERLPHISEIGNLLGYTYLKLKKLRKAEKLTWLMYQRHPNYLFAKINYADQCLRKKKLSEIPLIFKDTWHLHELCPEKKVFHYSELLGYACFMSFYFLAKKQVDIAKNFFFLAFEVDPNDASVCLLKRKLFRNHFSKLLLKPFKKTQKTLN